MYIEKIFTKGQKKKRKAERKKLIRKNPIENPFAKKKIYIFFSMSVSLKTKYPYMHTDVCYVCINVCLHVAKYIEMYE